jgi:hypothetical protein
LNVVLVHTLWISKVLCDVNRDNHLVNGAVGVR